MGLAGGAERARAGSLMRVEQVEQVVRGDVGRGSYREPDCVSPLDAPDSRHAS